MCEDEILEIIKDYIGNGMTDKTVKLDTIIYLDEAIKELYNMYQKEKEKNKELTDNYDKLTQHFIKNHISKDKIRAKIKELINNVAPNIEERDAQIYACDILEELLEEE